MKNTVSLCMITKNEQEYLAQCLKSVKNLVQEIIIVDTGSEDNTITIAESFGAKIYHHPWENDFSLHRNQSITYATGEWILIMDADEVISTKDHSSILSLLTAENADGFIFTLRNYENSLDLANININPNDYAEGKDYPGYIACDLIRLFRKNQQICFSGKVHEAVTESFLKTGKKAVHSGIPLHHYGKVRLDRIKTKQIFYQQLGEKRLEDNFNDPIAFQGLAEQYLDLGKNEEARTLLEKGLSLFPDYLELQFNLGLAFDRLGMQQEAKKEYSLVIDKQSQHFGAAHNLAQVFFNENNYEKCADILERSILKGLRHPAAFLLLGRAWGELKDYEKAILNIDLALQINPGYPNAYYLKAVFLLKIQHYDAAVEALGREIASKGNLCAAYNLLGEISLMWNDNKSAINFFQQVIILDPQNIIASKYLEQIPNMQYSNDK
ncbi:MAG: glycosyltransferase [Smithellaceae bacterium]